jgi:hypothetical protein
MLDLLRMMLGSNHRERLTRGQLLSDPFVSSLRGSLMRHRLHRPVRGGRDAGRCLRRKAAGSDHRKIDDQTKNDGMKKEGVPGPESDLD